MTIDVKDASGATVAIEVPNANGRADADSSRPVALSNEDKAAIDGLQTALETVETKLDTLITSNAAIETAVESTDPVSTFPYPTTPVKGIISTAMTGTTSTAVTGMGAPGASLYNYITGVIVSNTHATVGTNVELQDGSGGTTFAIFPAAAAYGGTAITFATPLKQPTANTALYAKNSTTGASTFLTVVGYTAA